MSKTFIGIDVGGTTVKIGIIDEIGNILDKWEIPTNTDNHGESILSDIWNSVSNKLSLENVAGIGIGVPGFIDQETGDVYEAVNIGWKQVELAKNLKEMSGVPVFVENDANAAVLGENWKGAGGQVKNLIAVTVGTGIGGGIIANGSILNGVSGTAGEIGHITMERDGSPCNCGRRGCLETISSATGIVRQAKEKIKENQNSMLAKFYAEQGNITAKDIFQLADSGDTLSKNIIEHAADVLGLAIANLTVTINPSRILIGGGVSKAGEDFVNLIDAAFNKYTLAKAGEVCEVKLAQLGNDAGIIGAAFLVKQRLEKVTF
ncbi:ROK family glucokinase [Virgibacillus ihumii]|uniref:ROK family glucokinase n=1 Tax=Virgibacillus ihumii TaxID=2686091 RepID=UPI00157DCE6F|nr:ROK family glucokinase [Virgibacillus ihumii]